ncbi:MAG: hypothetical protein HYY76_14175 [Acidobacteria bacterium]|nr:hypothetical protein [Acidobacteriota bacterium]
MIFNDRVDAVLCLGFIVVVLVVIAASARECWMVAAKRKTPVVNESPYVETQLDTVTA